MSTRLPTPARVAYELPAHPSTRSARGEQRFFYLDPPHVACDYLGRYVVEVNTFVIVSATYLPWGGVPETMIFPGTPDGRVASYADISSVNAYSHEAALTALGYRIHTGSLPAPVLDALEQATLTAVRMQEAKALER